MASLKPVLHTHAEAAPSPNAGRARRGRKRLALVRLTLTAFRNYDYLRLDLDGRPVALTGPNGAGKTNLLEAVSFLGAGRGLRGSRLADIDRADPADRGADGPAVGRPWAVAATLEGPDGPFDVGTGRDPEAGSPRRTVRIDGRSQGGPAALAARVPVLWLTPAQDRLFVDLPSARRRFLDRLVAVLDPEHAQRVSEYERALRERSRLLKAQAAREARADPAWLSALERGMAESGIAVAAARRLAAADLSAAALAGTGPFPSAGIAAAGEVETWLAEGPALDAEDRLAAALAASRGRDAETGGATHGPHRSDMMVVHAEKGIPAARMSTGEQKTLLISILLGAARLQAKANGFAPLLLLDEVAAHLDRHHRDGLYGEIAELGAQAWMTGTDPALFEQLSGVAAFLDVNDGSVRARNCPDAISQPDTPNHE